MKATLPLLVRAALCTLMAVGLPASPTFAAAGDLDLTFAPGGSSSPYAPPGVKRFVPGAGPQSFMSAATTLPDGRLMVASWCGSTSPQNTDICLSRLSTTGSFDTSFGTAGFASVGFTAGLNMPSGATVDTQGNTWVGGYCAGAGCIFKFSSSGGKYTNVGSGGQISVPGMFDVNSVAATADGRIVVGGRCFGTGVIYPCVARLLGNGTMDPTFNGGAIRRWGDDPFDGGLLRDGYVPRLSVRADGRIYAGNRCDTGTASSNWRMCVTIIAANGTLPAIQFPDLSYGYFYYAYFPASTFQFLYDIAVQSDGSVILAGMCATAGGNTGCMTRIIPGIGIDSSFGNNGVVTSVLGFGSSYAHGVVLREDGSIVLVHNCTASIVNFSHNGICLGAYTSTGAASPQFGGSSTRLLDLEAPAATQSNTGWYGATPGTLRGSGDTLYAHGACQLSAGAGSSCIARITLAPAVGKRCSPDIDGNGSIGGPSDGLLLMRTMFGLSGTAVTAGVAAPGSPRSTWPAVRDFLGSHCDVAVAP